jgi:DNA mismatch repair ATPase MutS
MYSGTLLTSSCVSATVAQVLDQLVSDILRSIHLVHKLVDSIALLDMLAAFAHHVACCSAGPYSRPQVTCKGPLAIVQVGDATYHAPPCRCITKCWNVQ